VVLALERIAKLRREGTLSEQEFLAAKARILGTSPASPTREAAAASFPAIEANVAAARRLADTGEDERHREIPPVRLGGSRGI
jgi:hypothetical protein